MGQDWINKNNKEISLSGFDVKPSGWNAKDVIICIGNGLAISLSLLLLLSPHSAHKHHVTFSGGDSGGLSMPECIQRISDIIDKNKHVIFCNNLTTGKFTNPIMMG